MLFADFLDNFAIPNWLFFSLIGVLVVLIVVFFIIKNKRKDD